VAQQSLGSEGLSAKSRRVTVGLHLVFLLECHKLPKVYDADVISAFWSGMTYRTLVQQLGHEQPKTTKELLNIATRHASSEEAVRAIFVQSSGKTTLGGGRQALATTVDKGTKRGVRNDKRGPKRKPQ
jgi:hypothetical protein